MDVAPDWNCTDGWTHVSWLPQVLYDLGTRSSSETQPLPISFPARTMNVYLICTHNPYFYFCLEKEMKISPPWTYICLWSQSATTEYLQPSLIGHIPSRSPYPHCALANSVHFIDFLSWLKEGISIWNPCPTPSFLICSVNSKPNKQILGYFGYKVIELKVCQSYELGALIWELVPCHLWDTIWIAFRGLFHWPVNSLESLH